MKKIISVLIYSILFCGIAHSQPVITKNDMPVSGDTIRWRSSMFAAGLNYQQTGLNFTWDFSTLIGTNTGADTFVAMNTTPLVYQFAFLLGSNNANLASPQTDINFIPGFAMTDIYNFYKNTTASYNMAGMGVKITGLPIPIKYNAPDVVYKFPISVGTEDSCQVSFAQGVPGLGYLRIQKQRHNYVDGWGTLILPTGSFQVVRVKSVITETDSLQIDTLGVGFSIPRNSIEYKWLATGKGLPVLQVTNSQLSTNWQWLDNTATPSNFQVTLPSDTSICVGESITLHAIASGGTPPYTYLWSTFQTGQNLTVVPNATTTYSVTVFDAGFATTSASVTISLTAGLEPNLITSDTVVCISMFPSPPFTTTAILTAANGFNNYLWSTGQSGASLNTISVQSPFEGYINYYVTVTNSTCTGVDSVRIHYEICEGIQDNSLLSNINVFPVPTIDNLNVSFSSLKTTDLNFEILNAQGIVLLNSTQSINSGLNSFEIDVKDMNLCPGFYLIRFTTKEFNLTKRLILE